MLFGDSGTHSLILQLLQQLLQQLVKCIVLAAQVPWKPRLVFLPKRAKILFGFGWKLLVSGVMDQGYQSLTDLIVGKVFTDRVSPLRKQLIKSRLKALLQGRYRCGYRTKAATGR